MPVDLEAQIDHPTRRSFEVSALAASFNNGAKGREGLTGQRLKGNVDRAHNDPVITLVEDLPDSSPRAWPCIATQTHRLVWYQGNVSASSSQTLTTVGDDDGSGHIGRLVRE